MKKTTIMYHMTEDGLVPAYLHQKEAEVKYFGEFAYNNNNKGAVR